ncbi:ATPase associated with various cellular activities AAA [Alicyclobacillus hesperidum URH17-3-68]|uniref:AAA family ATPase n=1 Tax=Alicyclobacillus hesperidum TaxID=89784 RepID=UPI000281B867|nr:AAA family ATPase [Alicyclobacillus hesperidum]EJY56434.1 ATPase associated with various cellular activities AAA [Alicyclobacillus hesperidum URH17-3-68]
MITRLYDDSLESIDQIGTDIRSVMAESRHDSVYTIPDIEPKSDLQGIPDSVYAQIRAALNAGKRHLIFYGPPGTGKTTLAQYVAQELSSTSSYEMLTASSSWTSQELIGGYQPIGDGKIRFVPGAILRNFDRPVVIDELNRCPIDKVIGPLFSVLSGQASTLPYKLDVQRDDSPFHVIYPEYKEDPEPHEWCPGQEWRLIATLNTVDKSQLGQISYALSRRFAWIKIGVPKDLDQFVKQILYREDVGAVPNPIANMWLSVNKMRQIGGAPIIDFIRTVQQMKPDIDLLSDPNEETQDILLHALSMYILPLLDGIRRIEAETFINELTQSWHLGASKRQELESEMVDIIV